jgi:outer membrane protein OmpA-like peptidoglycan-associated protein/tetratricopeptide (TPR) repeat protein
VAIKGSVQTESYYFQNFGPSSDILFALVATSFKIYAMRVTILCLLIVFSGAAFSQKKKNTDEQPGNNYDQGKSLYDKKSYTEAIPYFEACLNSDPANQDALYLVGLCYRYTNLNEKAITAFNSLAAINPEYWAWFYYEAGIAYDQLKQYENSVNMYEAFIWRFPGKPQNAIYFHQAKYKILYAKEQKALQALPKVMKDPVRLSDAVNTTYDDYMPALDPTGRKLYFTSQRVGGTDDEKADAKEGDEDIYFIELKDNAWSTPKLLPEPLNSGSNEGAACFSADGQVMVYTACGRDDGMGSCDLYISTLEGEKWTKPLNIGNIVNKDAWDSQPTMSYDGSKIIFASSRNDGYGDEDLYMIEKNIFGEWGPAMNLGGIVNTPFSDSSPFLSQDGKTLYFGSIGHPGYGGIDLFKTTLENGKWSIPVNLGKPLNTEGDDRYFTIGGSGEKGYFASNKQTGNLDLYEIEIPEDMRPQPTVVVSGTVTNAKSGSLVGAYVMVEDLNSGELIAVNKSNSVTGKYLVVLPAGKNYSVSANKEGFFFHSESFDVPVSAKFQEISKDIALKPIEKGAKVVLNNIFFETGKATLSPQSHVELEKASTLLKTNPSMIIEVGGHTDNVGDDESNMRLSHERAKSVREYLVKAGVDTNRIQAKGYGELNPIASNDNDEGRKANRRTEFIILEF